ncbi:Xanthine/uracil/vitamin C permease [Chloroherpeton thalassium ATCC 35110]|uniref:Xanthine/uracil/vitamin C permease n=1 Tax=Chloroherpeton thalassium (strain ATCC 35110 / GB-78) TaxID=517418 RepID=B3QTR1_CHLT3|nr:NCS2 family permease [Chloroherpeton thalassium]ACF14259.1 Xanthine/uracil/vitamin C permease [Chloroherpeton thalassium ATCC 35110]
MNRFFQLANHKTSYKQEVIAGLTTFFTMSYIIVVNPAILEAAGMPKGASMVATILTAIFGCLFMGFYAKRPFAIAPYMGENAFIAYTVVLSLGHSWKTALGAIFISGIIFTALTVLKLRSWLAEAIPKSLKFSFAVGIGLFLAFLGLQDMGVVALGVAGAPVKLAKLTETTSLLGILGLFITVALIQRKVPGAILIGILTVTGLSFALSLSPVPTAFMSAPPDISPVFLQLDISGALSAGFISVIVSVLVMDFVDTMGSLIGLSARANLLDKSGNLAEIEKPMLADALATIAASLFGTTTAGVYIESASGIEAGGRTGLTAIVVALMFGLSLFFAPILTAIPAYAYGPALVVVGMMMLESGTHINYQDHSEVFPAFLTIILMIYTFNIGVGMTAGFIAFPLLKVLSGRAREVSFGMWVLCIASIMFYFFYPYH